MLLLSLRLYRLRRPGALKIMSSHVLQSSLKSDRRHASALMESKLIKSFPKDGFGFVSSSDRLEEEKLPGYQAKKFYPVHIGDIYADRYQVLAKLGFGTTSTIWLCRDLRDDLYRCLKVCITDAWTSRNSCDNELSVSEHLQAVQGDHPGKTLLRLPLDSFELKSSHGQHHCLVFVPLGLNFAKFRRRFPDNSLPKQVTQHSVQILLIGLDFMHQGNVVHTDLSPSNILLGLVDSDCLSDIEKSELQDPWPRKILEDRTIYMSHEMPITGGMPLICDFGSARIGERHSGDVMPGQYRAPEVILEMEWTNKIDIWAFGNIIWDISQGHCLFAAEKDGMLDDEQHLAEMVSLLGPPPKAFLERSKKSLKYWDSEGNWIAATPVPEQSLEKRVKHLTDEDRKLFLQLLRKIFRWLPEERPAASDLFEDEFIYQNRLGGKS